MIYLAGGHKKIKRLIINMATEQKSSVRPCDKTQSPYYIAQNPEFTKEDIKLYDNDTESQVCITYE